MKPGILEKIREGIYFGTITKNDVLEMIAIAEDDLRKDKELKCDHNYIYQTGDYGYYKCSKCGINK